MAAQSCAPSLGAGVIEHLGDPASTENQFNEVARVRRTATIRSHLGGAGRTNVERAPRPRSWSCGSVEHGMVSLTFRVP